MKIALVVAAAGDSTRLEGPGLKQFRPLAGVPLIEWSLRTAASIEELSCIVAVVPSGFENDIHYDLDIPVDVLAGGKNRYESVRIGLESALARGCESAVVHDAARPFASARLFRRVINALLQGADAVVPVVAVTDTIKQLRDATLATVARDRLRAAQTPQGLLIEKVLSGYDAALGRADPRSSAEIPTDDVSMAEIAGLEITTVEGEPLNFKITGAEDWAMAEALVACRVIKVPSRKSPLPVPEAPVVSAIGGKAGIGFDAHRLVKGRPLVLGGVEIPYPLGLEGHSDGDAVSHAVADALLGAAGLGDIGTLYPSSDEDNRGRKSTEFLEEIQAMLSDHGLAIESVDVTVIAEKPRLEDNKEAIRRSVANALSIDTSQVSIKATTTDGLGITGSGEGIAALAAAVVRTGPKTESAKSNSES